MPSDRKLAAWLTEVAQALESGLSASEAVKCCQGHQLASTQDLEQSLRSGKDWTQSLLNHAHFLQDSEIEILSAATSSGQLPKFMKVLADQRIDLYQAKRRALLAALYPLFILHFGAIALPLNHIVVESEPGIYFTKVSMVLIPIWLISLFSIAGVKLFPSLGHHLGRLTPIFGRFIRYHELANFTKTLSVCQAAGLPLDRSWESAARATKRSALHKAAEEALKEIASGISPIARIQLNKTLPQTFKQKYQIGEATGTLDTALDEAATQFRSSARSSLTAASLFYPALLFGIAAVFAIVKVFSFWRDYFENFNSRF
ncbi:MAG: type II secretion system F family protein [Verrucomicrobiota bacterium]